MQSPQQSYSLVKANIMKMKMMMMMTTTATVMVMSLLVGKVSNKNQLYFISNVSKVKVILSNSEKIKNTAYIIF